MTKGREGIKNPTKNNDVINEQPLNYFLVEISTVNSLALSGGRDVNCTVYSFQWIFKCLCIP